MVSRRIRRHANRKLFGLVASRLRPCDAAALRLGTPVEIRFTYDVAIGHVKMHVRLRGQTAQDWRYVGRYHDRAITTAFISEAVMLHGWAVETVRIEGPSAC